MSIYRGRTKNEIYLASLLYDAIEDQDLRSVRTLLLTKGADANLVLPNKRISSFHLIVGNDCEKFAHQVVQLILQHGGNPNIQADDGLSPMHIAAAWGRLDVLYLLLCSGGDPEIRDSNRKTPLNYAHDGNLTECYDLLQSFVPELSTVMCRENEDCPAYNLVLDKILVNNGSTLGEYKIIKEYKTDSIRKSNLEELPTSNSKDYVIDWFNSQQQDSSSIIKITDNSSDNENNFSDFKESDNEIVKKRPEEIVFRKMYRKKAKISPNFDNKRKSSIILIEDSINNKKNSGLSVGNDYSRESGVQTLNFSHNLSNNTSEHLLANNSNDTKNNSSGDYVTCSSGNNSLKVLERNVFEITDGSLDTNLSFVSVSEIYKYVDKDQGIVLFEKRFLKTSLSSENNGSLSNSILTVKSSLPETIDYDGYDSDTIRKELTVLGYAPGPITVTTKRIYLKKLKELKKSNLPTLICQRIDTSKKTYSNELQKTLGDDQWTKDLSGYKILEDVILRQFNSPDPRRKWREGVNKSSFTYLLLDPRVTNNLPFRAESMRPGEMWEIFLSAIFYVGKGKRSRPYSHLYDAVNLYHKEVIGTTTGVTSATYNKCQNKKLGRILDIWKDGFGVVCLHVFQNTIPVEAYTREAAIITSLKLENLCNLKGGDFYGESATWTRKEKSMLGVFLLYKAMMIFMHEGERQLCPSDID